MNLIALESQLPLMNVKFMHQEKPATRDKLKAENLIFVVDDEPMLLELASIILTSIGYNVVTFRDPQMAVIAFSQAEMAPALVITDYSMHRMNGLEMIGAFREVNPKQKVLMVSGTVDEHIYRNADSKQKPNQFLQKPYVANQFTRLVKEMLGD